MGALIKEVGSWFGLVPKPRSSSVDFTARPCGEIDYDALCDEVTATYPKILDRLAQ